MQEMTMTTRKCLAWWPILLALCGGLLPTSLLAWDNLDIEAELRRPGVRLVVVEFYADWCAPCKKAVPMWNDLHSRYKERGLRLIVVSVGDGGTCSNPGWQPDKIVCDFDGRLQETFGADTLPQAFLYSWQGSLLVRNGHFPGVEKAVEAYFRKSPRIFISEPEGQDGSKPDNASALREIVRTDVRRLAKFEMVASDREMASLRALRKKGYQLNYDSGSRCSLGQDVSANTELKIKVYNFGEESTLVLQVFSVESGCMLASSKARIGSAGLETASFEAVGALVEQLVGDGYHHGKEEKKSPSKGAQAEELTYEELMKRAGEIEAAWKKAQEVASQKALPVVERMRFVEQFVANYGQNNPYAADAAALLRELGNANDEEVVGLPPNENGAQNSERIGLVWIPSKAVPKQFTKSEVTVGQFRACVDDGGCDIRNFDASSTPCNWTKDSREDHPMNCVDSVGAEQFCSWVGGRLPTEKEWWAEASNSGKWPYPWGATEPTCELAIWAEGGKAGGCGWKGTAPVCSRSKGNSVSGLCDMSGNVWEWTSTSAETKRFVVGGSFGDLNPANLDVSKRIPLAHLFKGYTNGFRCVRQPSSSAAMSTTAADVPGDYSVGPKDLERAIRSCTSPEWDDCVLPCPQGAEQERRRYSHTIEHTCALPSGSPHGPAISWEVQRGGGATLRGFRQWNRGKPHGLWTLFVPSGDTAAECKFDNGELTSSSGQFADRFCTREDNE